MNRILPTFGRAVVWAALLSLSWGAGSKNIYHENVKMCDGASEVFFPPPPPATNYVQEGTFECAPFMASGSYVELYAPATVCGVWEVVSGSVSLHNRLHVNAGQGLQPLGGEQHIDLNGGGPGIMRQTLTGLTPGQTYALSFWYAIHPITNFAEARVLIDGGALLDQSWSATNRGSDSWRYVQYLFTPTQSSVTLEFRGTAPNNSLGMLVDVIQVRENTTADLELSMTVDNPVLQIYQYRYFSVALTNAGPFTATNVKVDVPYPSSLAFASVNTATGWFDVGLKKWMVPSLAPGETAYLTLGLYTLTGAGTVSVQAEVVGSDQPDPDSSPGNGFCCEDDDAGVSLGSQDTTPPTVVLSTPDQTVNGPFTLFLNFSEEVTGLTLDDFPSSYLCHCSFSNLEGSGSAYTIKVNPATWMGLSVLNLQLEAGKVTDLAGNGNLASNPFWVYVDPDYSPNGYCTSESVAPWLEWIAKVETTNLSNASGKSQYSDFTNLTAEMRIGEQNPVTVTAGFSYFTWDEYITVHVDYNRDGEFDPINERAGLRLDAPPAGTTNASVTPLVWIPPGLATPGPTRMRVSLKRSTFPDPWPGPCETFPEGEVEDYTVNLVDGGGGGGACAISHTVANVMCNDSGTPGNPADDVFTFQLTVTGSNTGTGWKMTWNGGTLLGSYGIAKTVGPFPVANYAGGFHFNLADELLPTCTDAGTVSPPATCSSGGGGTPGTYCASSGDFPWHEWIAKVKLNDLSHASSKSQYSDYTNFSFTVNKGVSNFIELTTGFSWETYNEQWQVWIDYNHNGVFEDNERWGRFVLAPPAGTQTISASGNNLFVPQSALTGPTRMRVSLKRGGTSDPIAGPCGNIAYGEVEDYTVIVSNAVGGGTGSRGQAVTLRAVRGVNEVQLYSGYSLQKPVWKVVFEKSADGLVYSPLTIVAGSNEPGDEGVLPALDEAPFQGLNYYRATYLLDNGKVVRSPVESVFFERVADFTLYPNPATTEVFIQLPDDLAGAVLTVNDAQGQVRLTAPLSGKNCFVSLEQLPAGLYYFFVQPEGRRAVGKRLVVMR